MKQFYILSLLFLYSCETKIENPNHLQVFESFVNNITQDKINNEQLTLISQLILKKHKNIKSYSSDSLRYCNKKSQTYPISLFINDINRVNNLKNVSFKKQFELNIIKDTLYSRESLYKNDSVALIWFSNGLNSNSPTWIVKMTKPNNKWLVDIPILNYYKNE